MKQMTRRRFVALGAAAGIGAGLSWSPSLAFADQDDDTIRQALALTAVLGTLDLETFPASSVAEATAGFETTFRAFPEYYRQSLGDAFSLTATATTQGTPRANGRELARLALSTEREDGALSESEAANNAIDSLSYASDVVSGRAPQYRDAGLIVLEVIRRYR